MSSSQNKENVIDSIKKTPIIFGLAAITVGVGYLIYRSFTKKNTNSENNDVQEESDDVEPVTSRIITGPNKTKKRGLTVLERSRRRDDIGNKRNSRSANGNPVVSFVSKDISTLIPSIPTGFDELRSSLCVVSRHNVDFRGLELAINSFQKLIKDQQDEDFDFYADLLPVIYGYANVVHDEVWPLLLKNVHSTVSLSADYIRYMLANAFFLNIDSALKVLPDTLIGVIDFYNIYIDNYKCAVQRIICQLAYFYKEMKDDHLNEVRVVDFERIHIEHFDWMNCDLDFTNLQLYITTEGMEASDAVTFVDFANKDIHLHTIIASLTQEEVLFSCCPEAFISMLLCERISDDEIVYVRNLRRYSSYTGYLRTFAWTGFVDDCVFDTAIIDACHSHHFSEKNNIRDLDKAYCGFVHSNGKVSTGGWGCGAFAGDQTHKFLQQICAAVAANCPLDYSTFRDQNRKAHFEALLKTLIDTKTTVSELVKIMINYKHDRHVEDHFTKYIKSQLSKK